MKKSSNKIYVLWILAVTLSVGFLGFNLWSGTDNIPKVSEVKKQEIDWIVAKQSNSTQTIKELPPFDENSEYLLSAWSKKGMAQILDPSPDWTLMPAGSILEAQLFKRGPELGVVTEDVVISYSFDTTTNNGELLDAQGKPLATKGTFKLQKDSEFNQSVFATEEILALPYINSENQKQFIPYPMVKIEAHDKEGKLLAQTIVALPLTTEIGCKNCHTGDWRVADKAGIDNKTSNDVLSVHDRINKTNLVAQARAGNKIDCKSCHNETHKTGLNLSAAIHGWHAVYMSGQKAEACYSCHPGAKDSNSLFAFDVHATKNIDCINCHGYMEDHALSLLKQEATKGKTVATKIANNIQPRDVENIEKIIPRTAWVNLPSCASCHDHSERANSNTASSFNKWTKDETELFSNSSDEMGIVRCSTCHGAPHAIYPIMTVYKVTNVNGAPAYSIDKNIRANTIPLQYQKLAAPLGAKNNCAVCHNSEMEISAHHPLIED